MKILLINPPAAVTVATGWPPLGLGYIAGVLKKDFSVEVLDLQINPLPTELIVKYVKESKPDLVGFTATTPQIKAVFKITKIIKYNTQAKVIVGGPHPSILPEESLAHDIDFVVRGEGEETIYELCRNIETPHAVQGISYKKGGSFVHNPDRGLIKNLDDIPFPARDLFPSLRKYPAGYLQAIDCL